MTIRKLNTSTDERRSATRFTKDAGSDFAMLWRLGGWQRRVEVHSESLGGISLLVADAGGLPVGLEVRIEHAGETLRAVVRHVQRQPDGRYIVGLQCRRLTWIPRCEFRK